MRQKVLTVLSCIDKYSLRSLLPYKLEKRNSDIPKGLQEYFLLLISALETSKALTYADYHAFDALVGENFCQSRALKVALRAPTCRHTFQQKEKTIEKTIKILQENFLNKNQAFL